MKNSENVKKNYSFDGNDIRFHAWAFEFTGLSSLADDFIARTTNNDSWSWCFSPVWQRVDNTPEGAARRIEWLVEHGLPKNWDEQKYGNAPLIYNQQNKSQG